MQKLKLQKNLIFEIFLLNEKIHTVKSVHSSIKSDVPTVSITFWPLLFSVKDPIQFSLFKNSQINKCIFN